MVNGEQMVYMVTRIQALDIKMAVSGVIFSLTDEMASPDTTEEREKICFDAIEHRWKPILDLLTKQFNLQDEIIMAKAEQGGY